MALNSQMEYMKDIHENAQEAAKRALDSLQEVYRKAEEEENRLRQETIRRTWYLFGRKTAIARRRIAKQAVQENYLSC